MMNTETFTAKLKQLGACDDALEWVATQPDAETAWATCPRHEWLMWLLGELHIRGALTRQTLVLAACAAAETALPHVLAGEERPRVAIETALRWARGEATVEEVRVASADADAYYARAAARAARAAAHAAARAAAHAAAAAAYYAYYAYYAADAADAADADATVCDAIRSAVPWEVVEAALAFVE
jgi:hypothetical protein